jgi:hypothetical protein
MKKKISFIIILLVFVFSLAGCSTVSGLLGSSGVDNGEIGKKYSTKWFDFEIKDYYVTDTYAGYDSFENYKYLVFTIWEKNTYKENIPMAPGDFLLESDELLEEDTYPYGASGLDYYERCMPDTFELTPKEESEYEVVFEIPDEVMEVAIYYTEVDDEGKEGNVFRIPLSLTDYSTVSDLLGTSGLDNGEIGKKYSTKWFDFEIKDYYVTNTYAGYDSIDNYKYLVFTIWEKNTYNENIPMALGDFLLESDELLEEDTYPYGASGLDYYEKCMPDTFELTPKEESEYEVVFEIPDEVMEVAIYYTELDDEGKEGNVFRIPLSLTE